MHDCLGKEILLQKKTSSFIIIECSEYMTQIKKATNSFESLHAYQSISLAGNRGRSFYATIFFINLSFWQHNFSETFPTSLVFISSQAYLHQRASMSFPFSRCWLAPKVIGSGQTLIMTILSATISRWLPRSSYSASAKPQNTQ